MFDKNKERYANELIEIKNAGLYKNERIITTPQGVEIKTKEAGRIEEILVEIKKGKSV